MTTLRDIRDYLNNMESISSGGHGSELQKLFPDLLEQEGKLMVHCKGEWSTLQEVVGNPPQFELKSAQSDSN